MSSSANSNKNSGLNVWRDRLMLIVKGFCMGMADLVPGVSGGTMAFLLGIYARLIRAISSFDRPWLFAILGGDIKTVRRRPHWGFVIPLVVGIFAALLFFTRVVSIPDLLVTHQQQVYGLFFGLILASIVVLLKEVGRMRISDGILLGAGTALALLLVTRIPFHTPETGWFVFLAGAIAICAMILPGVSGSFLLLLMKKYAYIISAVGRLDFTVLLPFVLGCLTGLVLFSRVLNWLLNHCYRQTLLVIKGVLIASLWVLWPFQSRQTVLIGDKEHVVHSTPVMPDTVNEAVIFSLALAVTGFVVVIALDRYTQLRK
jgi:putative membrane protein